MAYKVIFTRVYEIPEEDILGSLMDHPYANPSEEEIKEEAINIATSFLYEEMPEFLENPEDFCSAKVETIKK